MTTTQEKTEQPTKLMTTLEKLQAAAERAQKQRRKAPMVDVNVDIRIPAKDIIKRMAAKTGGQDADYHYLFVPGAMQSLNAYAHKGYEIVMDDGDMVMNETDVLVRIPTEFYDEELAANSARDDRRLKKAVKDVSANSQDKNTTAQLTRVGPKRT